MRRRQRESSRSSTRAVLLVPLVIGCGLLGIPAAQAHADLETSDPAEGAEVAEPPGVIRLQFDESPAGGSRATVFDGCGREVTADVAIAEQTIEVTAAGGQAGLWTVRYAVLSDVDGHPSEGTLSFLVAGPTDCSAPSATAASAAAASAAPAPSEAAGNEVSGQADTESGSGAPVALLAATGAAVLIAGAVVGFRVRGRRRE